MKSELKALLRLLIFLALAIPGGFFYMLNFVGIENKVFLLIFAQILPLFSVSFVPFFYADKVSLQMRLLAGQTHSGT